GEPHRCVGQIAVDAAVQRAHRVVVALVGLHLEDRMARLDGLQDEPQQSAHRGRWYFTPQRLLSQVEYGRHVRILRNRPYPPSTARATSQSAQVGLPS